MKLAHVLAITALSVTTVACKKSDDAKPSAAPAAEGTAAKPSEPGAKPAEPAAAAAPAGRKIPNSSGLVVDAPAKWLDNGIGGAAGMHLDGDAGMFMVRETSAEEAAKKLAEFKTDTESTGVKKWVSAEETPDGFKTLYTTDKLTMKGDEMVKDGELYAFHVRRKIGDKAHDCYGSAAKQADASEAIDLCMKIAAK
jgi:hypothetical protein